VVRKIDERSADWWSRRAVAEGQSPTSPSDASNSVAQALAGEARDGWIPGTSGCAGSIGRGDVAQRVCDRATESSNPLHFQCETGAEKELGEYCKETIMSFFGKILEKLGLKKAEAAPVPQAPVVPPPVAQAPARFR